MGTNKETVVEAPKTIERLEEISSINGAKRKAEEAAEDAEEDNEEDKLKIFDGGNISLDITDIHDSTRYKVMMRCVI